MKNSLDRFNSRVEMTEDVINEPEDKSIDFPILNNREDTD